MTDFQEIPTNDIEQFSATFEEVQKTLVGLDSQLKSWLYGDGIVGHIIEDASTFAVSAEDIGDVF